MTSEIKVKEHPWLPLAFAGNSLTVSFVLKADETSKKLQGRNKVKIRKAQKREKKIKGDFPLLSSLLPLIEK